MNDLDDLYGDDKTEVQQGMAGIETVDATMKEEEGDEDVARGDDASEEESDSDVEFVIDMKPGQRAEPPTTKAQPYAAIKIQKPGTTTTTNTSTPANVKKEPIAKLPDVDVDAIAEMDGKSILEVDLESLENKPWRQPGADITEYFNYGFDEFTWTAYCQKQTTLRADFAPSKVMQGMMGAMDPTMMGGVGGGMMMPPMDPNMMQQMYGSMPMDFMQAPPVPFHNAPMPQPGQFNRNNGPPPNMAQRQDTNSPMLEAHRDDNIANMPNIPRGPAQNRNHFRPRGGAQPNRW